MALKKHELFCPWRRFKKSSKETPQRTQAAQLTKNIRKMGFL
jgi:hypothetical protein